MSKNDLVSVVIPVFNSEKFLAQSIESILNQSYKEIEIIAIDDGSTDNSLQILEKFSDVIQIIIQPNSGLASSLNVAINKIKGKWFKWFSPDDLLCEDAIQTLVDEAKKLPDNYILYSNWEMIDENNHVLRNFNESNYNNLNNFDFNIRLLDGQQINVNSTLIPTSLFQKGCMIRNLDDPVAIDYDFFLRAALLYETKFHLISKNLLKYRIHNYQLSHKHIVKTLSYISELKNEILYSMNEFKKEEYLTALKKYQKIKPISKKTLDLSLKLAQNTFPDWITDRLLVFYLNKLRQSR